MDWGRVPIVTGLGVMIIIFIIIYCFSRFCRCKFNHDTSDNYVSDDDLESCPE